MLNNRITAIIFLISLILHKYFPTKILAEKIKMSSLEGEKLKTQLLESLNSYGKIRGTEGFLENFGNIQQPPQKLFLDAQTTFKAFDHPDNPTQNNLTSMLTENEKATKQAKTLGEWRRKIYKFLEINKRKGKINEEPPPSMNKQQSPSNDDNSIQQTVTEKGEENNNMCNHYKEKENQNKQQFQNKIIRLAPIQPIFTSVKENPIKWHFGNYKIKENAGGCGDEEQQQLTLMPLEKENNRLKANKNLPIPLPPIQQLPPPPPPPQPSTFPQLPFLPLQFPNSLFPTLPSLISPFQSSSSSTNQPLILEQQNPEKEYLKELENVSEDYLDEQENRLPCPENSFGCKKQYRDQQMRKKVSDLFIENNNKEKQKNNKIDYEEEEEENIYHQKNFSPSPQFPQQWNENREMCNSNRLKSLIFQLLLNKINNPTTTNIERSKRFLQQKAETLFGTFFNVICGTGFFSYIAHTDEFCLVAVKNVHCYVFSPVCSSQRTSSASSIGGIGRQQRLAKESLQSANSRNTKNNN